MKNYVAPSDFTRVNSDINGNPRYVCHFLQLVTEQDKEQVKEDFAASLARNPLLFTSFLYDFAVKKAHKAGGRKYTGKNYGGGIVFQTYNSDACCEAINKALNS